MLHQIKNKNQTKKHIKFWVIAFIFAIVILCTIPVVAHANSSASAAPNNDSESNDIVTLTWDMKDVAKDGRIPVTCQYPEGPQPKWFDSDQYAGEQDGMYIFGNGNSQVGSAIVYTKDNDYKGFCPMGESTVGTGPGSWTMDSVAFPYDPERFTKAKSVTFSIASWKAGTYNFQLKYVDDNYKVQVASDVVSVTITEDQINTFQYCTINCYKEADLTNRKLCLTWDAAAGGNIAVCQTAKVEYYGKKHVAEFKDGEGGAMELPKTSIVIAENNRATYFIDSKTKKLTIKNFDVDTGAIKEEYLYEPVSSVEGGLPGKWFYQKHTTEMLNLVEDSETEISDYMLFIPSYVCPVKITCSGDSNCGSIVFSSNVSDENNLNNSSSDFSSNITYGSKYYVSTESPDTIVFIDKVTSQQILAKAIANDGYRFDSWDSESGIVDRSDIKLGASFSKIDSTDNNQNNDSGYLNSAGSTGDYNLALIAFVLISTFIGLLMAIYALASIHTKEQ